MTNNKPIIVPVDAAHPEPAAIKHAVKVLRAGGLVIVPTETVYGLAADPQVDGAEERIYEAKTRDRGKPIPLMATSLDAVKHHGATLSPLARRLARRYWPGPLTLVLPCGDRTEGFRVPDHAVTQALLKASGGVLRVTSANVSGEPAAVDAATASAALGDRVGLVLDAGPAGLAQESTVVDATGKKLRVLRKGAIPADQILARPTVLFVCTGNVCRSPMAEYLLRRWLGADTSWEVASAGVATFDGMPASEAAVDALEEEGMDASGHRSQQLTRVLVDAADLIVVMTQSHRRVILERFPKVKNKVVMLNAFNGARRNQDVEDPIGMSLDVYRAIRDEMNAAMPDLVLHLHELLQ
jgi:L-threonylcarbamoyladenylate synthase